MNYIIMRNYIMNIQLDQWFSTFLKTGEHFWLYEKFAEHEN